MKKLFLMIAVLALMLMLNGVCYAGESKYDSVRVVPTGDDTYGFRVQHPDGTDTWSVEADGTVAGSFTRTIPLPLMSFVARTSSVACSALANSISVSPALALLYEAPYAEWADGETNPIIRTFRIPSNYKSGGQFNIMATQTATGCYIDYTLYWNRAGTNPDTAALNQTAVLVSSTTVASPALVTLTPATDFSAFAAGDWVSFGMWRDDDSSLTGSLRVFDAEFVYTADQ
jgi:hypothetical protein